MSNRQDYDFCGWATKNDLLCSDGRTIRKNAFKDDDGICVPLVWNHQHNDPMNVLGHAILQNRDEGVYAYGVFNDTEQGQNAKKLVGHGDVVSLSIYANQLKQSRGDVLHGKIREVSLVLAGANPGATIESVLSHGEETDEEAIIFTGEEISMSYKDKLKHAMEESIDDINEYENDGPTVADVLDTMNEDQMTVLNYLIEQASGEQEPEYADDEECVEDPEEYEDAYDEDEGDEEEYEEEYEDVKHNVFDTDYEDPSTVLSHSDMEAIIADAPRCGSMREAAMQHDAAGVHYIAHSITNVSNLFPDARTMGTTPEFYKRDTDWVDSVMSGVHHTPFSRVKTMYADITGDEARAKGYVKGNQKIEEVIAALKRQTTPTTVYKLQKMDRDDVLDITDFDVIAWLKQEMRIMLNEEIARAILVGDGRSVSSNDHINPQNIRPIWTDDEVYTIHRTITVASNATADNKAKALIRESVKSRKDYKGSGNPVMFTTEDWLTDMLLMEDNMGRVIYDTQEKLATALRVSKIVTVPVMENLTRTNSDSVSVTLAAIIVNLNDYNVGADKGGEVNLFDDFDINYNKQEYLIETRCSGALTKPKSAIALEIAVASSSGSGSSSSAG